jgi:ribosomal 30S subunit maturation factor RimM
MNISSSFQFTSPNIANLSPASFSRLRVNQAQTENLGLVIQPVDEITTPASANNERSQVAALNNNEKPSDKQAVADDNEVSAQAQDQRQQEALIKELERRQTQELIVQNRQVRDHERAHSVIGGHYAGLPRYTFERGPDGINYAVAGEVSISAGVVTGDPAATIQKAQVVRRAALAPTEPSAQDKSVAAQAAHIESQAMVELRNIESRARLTEGEAADARIKNRQANIGSTSQAAKANDSSVFAHISPNSLQDSIAEKAENRVQRLSDDLNLRLSRADPFGSGPEPGQTFSQFI